MKLWKQSSQSCNITQIINDQPSCNSNMKKKRITEDWCGLKICFTDINIRLNCIMNGSVQFTPCSLHQQQQIKYFCSAEACNYTPLCDVCCKEHQTQHHKLELIPLKKALLIAQSNLRRQESEITKYLNPLKTRETMLKTIEKQKEDLLNQKNRLIQFISDKIDSEIRVLESSNQTDLNREEINIKKTLELKLQDIDKLNSPSFSGKILSLRAALNFQTSQFIEELLSKHNQTLAYNRLTSNRSTKFKLYQSTHHEIMLSPLNLRQRTHQRTKQIKRVMNQSPLYFLIDQNLSNSNHLFSLAPDQKRMYTYNIDHDDWSTTHTPAQICRQGAAVHDYKRNRFFWIGGVTEQSVERQPGDWERQQSGMGGRNKKSNKIFVYEPDNKDCSWRQLRCTLKIPRSSCQAVLIEDKNNQYNCGIVIAGGLGPDGQVLKSTEYLNLQTEEVQSLGDTNFGAFSGTLVTYNNSNVLRIGGLYKNKADVAVVEIVERLDCTQWLRNMYGNIPKWGYVEILVPEFDRSSKASLFNANQGAIQINPNEIFVFGGFTSGMKGVVNSFIIGVEEFDVESREINAGWGQKQNSSGLREKVRQYKFTVRWVNEKPLITGDDFGSQCPALWKGRLYVLQNIGNNEMVTLQKRLLSFNMYEWSEIEEVLPQ